MEDMPRVYRMFFESINAWFLIASMARRRMIGLCCCCSLPSAPAFSRTVLHKITRRSSGPTWKPEHLIWLDKVGYDPNVLDTDKMGALMHLVRHTMLNRHSPQVVSRMNAFVAPLLFHTTFSKVDHRHPITHRTPLQILVHAWILGCCHPVMDMIEMLVEARADPFLHCPHLGGTPMSVAATRSDPKRRVLFEVFSESSYWVFRRSRFCFAALFATDFGDKASCRHPFSGLPLGARILVASFFNPINRVSRKRKASEQTTKRAIPRTE